jgi:superfamily II DNA or RNA helicase
VAGGVKRNALVAYYASLAKRYGLSAIALVQRGNHGLYLQRMLTDAGLRVNFIRGEHDQAEREAGINALRDGRIDTLIGSTILDVGVDMPSVGMIINASGGKAEVATRQRYGRGLREKKNGMPNVAFIVEFDDWQNSHLRQHSIERRRIIEETPGFAEGIVDRFDFESLGFGRLAA